MQTKRCIVKLKIGHLQSGKVSQEMFVFLPTDGGDVGKSIVLNLVEVQSWCIYRSCKDVDEHHDVAHAKPPVYGQRNREGSIVPVRGKHEDIQIMNSRIGPDRPMIPPSITSIANGHNILVIVLMR